VNWIEASFGEPWFMGVSCGFYWRFVPPEPENVDRSFPHEFPGYRHVSDESVRTLFEDAWGLKLLGEPGLRIPNMFEAALDGEFKGLYIEGEDIAQSDSNTQHVTAALTSMECIIVQDLFLNESAKFAHVFLPGSSFYRQLLSRGTAA
jgi:predicted molibdopterin-dependent oxidoreductase YjgC